MNDAPAASYSRADLFVMLGLTDRAITKGLDMLNDRGRYEETGNILPNGKPEKRYRYDDLPARWKKKLFDAVRRCTGDARSPSESTGDPGPGSPAPLSFGTAAVARAAGITADAVRWRIRHGRMAAFRENGRYRVSPESVAARTDIDLTALSGSSAYPPAADPENTVSLRPDMLKEESLKHRLAVVAESEQRPAGKKAGEWYAELAARHGLSLTTLYRWIKEIRGMRGSVQVLDAAGVNLTVSAASCSRETIEYLIGLYLQNERQVKYDLFKATREKAVAENWRIGSDATLYRIVQEVRKQTPGLVTLARGGRLALEKELSPAMRRDLLAFESLEMLVGDQHIFDWLVRDDDGNAVRPECYAWFDMRSRMWLGLALELGHYNKFTIGRALIDACRYGNPTYIYTDLGKPELSRYLAELRTNLTACRGGERVAAISELRDLRLLDTDEPWLSAAIARDTGDTGDAGAAADAAPDAGAPDAGFTGHRKARGRHPRSKPIEGYFAILERQLYRRLGGLGYCKKQDNPDDNLKLEQGLRADAQAGRLLHYTEFAALVAEVVNWWNSHELSTDRIVPSREFFDDLARHPKPVFDAQTLDFIFLPTEERCVRDSKLAIDRVEYYAPELSRYSGRFAKDNRVLVKRDPYRPDMVYVLERGTRRFLARAERWDSVNPKIPEQLAKRIAAQQRLMKTYTDMRDAYAALAPKLSAFSTWRPAADAAAAADEAFELTKGPGNKVSDTDAKRWLIDMQSKRKTA